jgi:DNA-binding SARP family transcriptional activator/class 3 adenylate cyclase/WD40 repeat protein
VVVRELHDAGKPSWRRRRLAAVGNGGGRVATWSVLFTDMVGSTEMRVRVGEEAFDRVRTDIDTRVGQAIAAHDGAAVKSTGDGVLAGFTATAAALRCAAAIQAAMADRERQAGDGVAMRVGISVGDAIADNGDLQGTAVVEAARLCAAAAPGTILCSAAVQSVSANRSGCSFGEPRSLELKGMPAPVVVHEVLAGPARESVSAGLSFGVLGPLVVERDGRAVAVGGPKERLVLALLISGDGRAVSVDALVEAVWGDRRPRTAERTLHAYIARLRRALEAGRGPAGAPDAIETVGRGYRLATEPEQIDAGRFEQLARSGAALLAAGEYARAAADLRAALTEWRGAAYADHADVERCATEAARLEAFRLDAFEDRIEAELAGGGAGGLVSELEEAVGEQPFRERLWGQLMVALYRTGRQRDALGAYQRARGALVDELGIEPGPELRRLEAAILDQDPGLDIPAGTAAPRGPHGLPLALATVGSAFVGRDGELAWLLAAWDEAEAGRGGFVSVLGAEGAGKTRLAAELARAAHDAGAVVLYGRCDHAHGGARALVDQALGSAGGSPGPVDPVGEGDDLATCVARQLPAWAGDRPVLLVLDDLHVADAATLEFVADLAGWCRATRILVVGAFRNDGPLPVDRDTDAAGEGSRVVLGPLDEDAVASICRIYEPDGWTAEAVRQVADLSEGIPLHVHEQASALARERATVLVQRAADRLAASRGRLVVSRGEVADGVETIQRLLEQRRAQLAGRQARRRSQGVAALAGCPYKGLARFEAADADNFFGRERLVAELVARVSEASLVAVVGPSGSGKSSLLRAGLLPALEAGVLAESAPWRATALCPGARPSEELAAAARRLPPGDAPAVMLVDQFEEVFTLGVDDDEQAEFIDALLELCRTPATTVVLAVRADHLGRCAAHPELAAALAGNDLLVGPMRDSELRRTVELPALRAGLQIEPGLVDVIVTDVAGRAGALPLLSTALAETWERREGHHLTLAGYRAAGGVNGALARLAEDGYGAIPVEARPAARRILLRLCDAGEDAALDVRRRLPLTDVVDEGDRDGRAALDALADRRLLSVDGDTVEVAHEALLREWPRLRAWLDEDVDGRRLHRRLGDAARAWDADGREPSELYRGAQLDTAAEWADGHAEALNRSERAFLNASRDATSRERAEAAQRAAERVRANRRLRRALVGVGVLLVASLVAGAVAVGQRGRAEDARSAAERQSDELALQALVGEAGVTTKRDTAALLALAAYEIEPRPDTFGALLGTFTAAPHIVRTQHLDDVKVSTGALLPDGRTFAVVDDHLGVTLVDVVDGRTIRTLPATNHVISVVKAAAVSPDGRLLAVVGAPGPVPAQQPGSTVLVVRDLRTGERQFADVIPSIPPASIAFSPDGRLLALGGGSGPHNVEIRSAADGRLLSVVPSLPEPPGTVLFVFTSAVTFLPDGSLVVTSEQGDLRIVDPVSGAELRRHEGPQEVASRVVVASDDGRMIYASGPRGVSAWSPDQGLLWAHHEPLECTDLVVDTLGGRLLCSSQQGRVAAFALQDGAPSDAGFAFQHGEVWVLDATPDGRALVQAGGPVLVTWRLDGGGAVSTPVATDPQMAPTDFLDESRLLMNRGRAQGWAIVDTRYGEIVDPLDGIVGAVVLSGRRPMLAVEYADGTTGTYDPNSGERLPESVSEPTFVPQQAISIDDGIVVWSDSRVQGINSRGLVPPTVTTDPGLIRGLAMSADGTRLITVEGADELVQRRPDGRPTGRELSGIQEATTSADVTVVATVEGRIDVLDAETLEPVGPPLAGIDSPANQIDTDDAGDRLLIQGKDQTVRLADVRTRQFLGGPIEMGKGPGSSVSPDELVSPYAFGLGWSVLRDDGDAVAIQTDEGTIVWDLDPDSLADAACRVAGRNLTRAEWDEHIGGLAPYRELCPDEA